MVLVGCFDGDKTDSGHYPVMEDNNLLINENDYEVILKFRKLHNDPYFIMMDKYKLEMEIFDETSNLNDDAAEEEKSEKEKGDPNLLSFRLRKKGIFIRNK